MDLSEFEGNVRDVLAHLYDRPYLQTHPLANLIAPHQPGEIGGQALQRKVLDAIEALKPSPDVPYDSLPWRKYRYVYLRYVQGLSIDEIASDLVISTRQARRYSLESLTAVARILWERYQDLRLTQRTESSPIRHPPPAILPTAVANEQSAVDLEVARIEAQERTSAIPVGELVRGVVATIGLLAERRRVDLRLSIPPNYPAFGVERTVLRQALLSLLSLSVDLNPIQIEVTLEVEAELGGGKVVIRCSQCGNPGCSPPLAEGEAVSPRRMAGAEDFDNLRADHRWHIAQHLVKAHGGWLDVLSIVDRDLTIGLGVSPVRLWKVLVVEDNPDTIELFRRYLGDAPYRVLATANSAEALAHAEVERPSVILLDVMMPARDGWEILQLLKSNPTTQEIPVIICSVLREYDLALALGASEVLVKPVGRADLLQALERQCSNPIPAHRGLPANSASDR